LVLAAPQSELLDSKGSAQAEPKVWTDPWLRPNEKFDFMFGSSLAWPGFRLSQKAQPRTQSKSEVTNE